MPKGRKRSRKKAARGADVDARNPQPEKIEPFERDLEAAEADLLAIVHREDLAEVEGVKLRTHAAARVQHLRSLVLGMKGEHGPAAKAGALAAKFEKAAIDAAKATLPDRVAAIEAELAEAKDRGKGIRALARARN